MDPINTFLTTTCIVTVATVVAVTLIARSKDNLRRETEARAAALEERRKKQLAAELDRVKPNVVEADPVKLTVSTYAAVPKKEVPPTLKEILAEAVPRSSLSVQRSGYVPPAPRANEPDVITPIVVTSILMADSNRDYSPAPSSSCDSGSSSSSSYDSGSSSSCGGGE